MGKLCTFPKFFPIFFSKLAIPSVVILHEDVKKMDGHVVICVRRDVFATILEAK